MTALLHWIGIALVSSFVSTGLWLACGKKLISHLLERAGDKFRADLRLEGDTQIERLRSSLQLTAFEQQVRFSRLHARRATIIAKLYKLLNEVPRYAGTYILKDPYDLENERAAKEKVYELYIFIENHRIYFPANVCNLLDVFSKKLSHSITHFSLYWTIASPTEATRLDQRRILLEAVQLLETDLPAMKRELEAEFRKLLGDLDGVAKT
jgi:hypothetical protein